MKLSKQKAKKFNKLKFPIVKATVGAIIEKNSRILLTKRNVRPDKGKWCLPGGHIDIGETAVNTIRREAKEETGLKVKNIKFFKYYDEYLPKLKIHSIVLIFHGKPRGKEKINKEVIEQKWFSQKEIKKLKLAFIHNKVLNEFFNER